jgi:hypothetical protein
VARENRNRVADNLQRIRPSPAAQYSGFGLMIGRAIRNSPLMP